MIVENVGRTLWNGSGGVIRDTREEEGTGSCFSENPFSDFTFAILEEKAMDPGTEFSLTFLLFRRVRR